LKMKKSRIFFGLAVGLSVWFALDPRLRSKVYQSCLKLAEKGLVFTRRSLDDLGEKLLLAVQVGLEEARKREAELKQKVEFSKTNYQKT